MYSNIKSEEEIKVRVGQDWFGKFDCAKKIGNIDFCVTYEPPKKRQKSLIEGWSLLWAEAKRGDYDLYKMFAQLILTIGKAKTYAEELPPKWLAVFDAKKIVFVEYEKLQLLFYQNDFKWSVTLSNDKTPEFAEIKEAVVQSLKVNPHYFEFIKDKNELQDFIEQNIASEAKNERFHIHKSNFINVFHRWLKEVRPLIKGNVSFSDLKKDYGIVEGDFYLADLFIDDNGSTNLKDFELSKYDLQVSFVVIPKAKPPLARYEILNQDIKTKLQDFAGDQLFSLTNIEAYLSFWNRYQRPPLSDYHDYILKRRDKLVPSDIRERSGAFFTPSPWVELSQQYLADVFGVDWQDEYVIWDPACGTGNLLEGLVDEYNIFASTLDNADVKVVHTRIDNGTSNLLTKHVFQFDFFSSYKIKSVPLNMVGNKSVPQAEQIFIDDGREGKYGVYEVIFDDHKEQFFYG